MNLQRGSGWMRRGLSLLWDSNTLLSVVAPGSVVSLREFFAIARSWPDELPGAGGDALVVAGLGVCRIQAASNPYAGKSQPIGETRTRYSRKFRVNRAKGDVCCPHLTAKRDQSDRLLEGCLDALSADDGSAWLETDLKRGILEFQDEYQGQAALIFWLPSGRRRVAMAPATEEYFWKYATSRTAPTLPIGRCLWAGADSDAARIIVSDARDPDIDGPAWVGLYHPRIS